MNGSRTGDTASISEEHNSSNASQAELPRIREALQAVHSPQSTNESRQAASSYLENVKLQDSAPYHGFVLAHDLAQPAVVRHFALSLLEHAIKHKWSVYSDSQAEALRSWVLELAQAVSQDDPLYIRNKTAQLWVEIAKRCWGGEWINMDELLVQMWQADRSLVHKEFVLFVLEMLSEDVFQGEDTAALLREGILNKACVEIFTPAVVLAEVFPERQIVHGLRAGESGWLARVCELLEDCLSQDMRNNEQIATCAAKCLAVQKSVLSWITPAAIKSASCVKHFCSSLAAPSIAVQMNAIDAMNSLYLRSHFSDADFVDLVCPMYTSDNVSLLQKVYEWSVVDPNDIDDEKYALGKRLSEMLSLLGNFVEQKVTALPEGCDLPHLLNLFLSITQSQSFVISIPILVTWTRLLKSPTLGGSNIVSSLIAPLLELCSSRLIRFESFPDDSDDPCMVLLFEDIDTIPERHAFLGNYRRYCVQVIEYIVHRKRSEAIYHILSQVAFRLQHLYDNGHTFSFETYSKNSFPALQVDAQFTVIEAALKGYMKWKLSYPGKLQLDIQEERQKMEDDFEIWCNQLLEMQFEDPIIRKRIISLSVAFSTSALEKKSAYLMKVLEAILMSRLNPKPECPAYTDAAKELHSDSLHELTRLATKMPDQLLEVYDQLEAKINEITSRPDIDKKHKTAYQTFLFIIILRAANITPEQRVPKLQSFIDPIKQSWQDPVMNTALNSIDGYCNLLGLNKARDYMIAHRVHEVSDWSTLLLDEEGKAIQIELEERLKALPLRTTKSFLSCSMDKVDKESSTWKISASLWQDAVPIVLPGLLNFVSHSHAYYTPENWAGLPSEMLPIVSRILTDRFWQAGISEGSKDDFYARVQTTKSTMEGMASTIRGSVRTARDCGYNILYGLSRLDVHFYGFEELPGPLAHALFADAHCLSSHQLINLLTLVRHMVDDCPVEVRAHFVPPILATCFTQIDGKMTSEWERLGQKQQASTEDDNLTDEMKEESILRQLTYNSVMMVAGVLDPGRGHPPTLAVTNKEASTYISDSKGSSPEPKYPTMRQFCLTNLSILEPLLLFCTHAIRFRDTRCCGVVLRVLRTLISEFATPNEITVPIREFISSEILKACVTSLHESYFVDLQRNLAELIASILVHYTPTTATPRDILLSLPGLTVSSVDKCIDFLCRGGAQSRQQRAMVLDLLKDLKGVSISEQGRITKSVGAVRRRGVKCRWNS